MERQENSLGQYFKKQTAARVAGAILVGFGGEETSTNFIDAAPIPVVRAAAEMNIMPQVNTLYRIEGNEQRNALREELVHAETVGFLNSEITSAREKFLEESLTQKGRLAYAVEFDAAVYDVLNQYKWVNRTAYEEVRNDLDAQTEFNQVTLLGEIFHSGLSTWTTRLEADGIYADTGDEPSREMVKRGAQYRIQNGSKEPEREQAVVDGFLATEKILMNSETPIGTTVLSISPTGPQHEHNFYDTATKRENEERGVYVEWRRYSSALSRSESAKKLSIFDTRYTEKDVPSPTYFLKNVVTFVSGESHLSEPDDIHRYLHKEHGALTEEQLKRITQSENAGYRRYYRDLLNDPSATYEELEDAFRAMINNAFFVAGKPEESLYSEVTGDSNDDSDIVPDSSQIAFFAGMSMPAMALPCGLLGGLSGGMGPGFMNGINAYGMPMMGGFRPEDDPNLCKKCIGVGPHFDCPGKMVKIEKGQDSKEKKKEVPCDFKVLVGSGITKCPKCKLEATCK